MKKILADTRSDSTASATRGLLSTALNSNPATHEADSDSDGLKDGAELTAGTQARNPDSDDDYLTDYEEVNNLYALAVPTSPLNGDSNDDGTPDYGEASLTDSDAGGQEALTPRLNNRCAGSPLQRHRPFDRRAGNCGGV
ncbi:MAG: hypothetical protein QE570_10715 [Verrucomicrobiota bacterium]|nr:hypothetical protein [Verrucomicrobiota bacterium]